MSPKSSRHRPSSPASNSRLHSPPSKFSHLPKPWPSWLPLPRLGHKLGFSPPSSASPLRLHSPSRNFPPELSPALLREIQQVFEKFDSNHDGRISADELSVVLRCFGDNVSEVEALKMVAEVDFDGDGFISLNEFIDLNTRSLLATGEFVNIDELTATFDMFDLDKNGCITAEELHCVLVNLGDVKFSVEECKRMIRGVDRKGAGHVDFDDFKRMMMASA